MTIMSARRGAGAHKKMLPLDPLALAPPEDQPVSTLAALPASALPTLAGATTWLREKRIGSAETTGTGGPSTDLDLENSTRFRYPGLYSGIPFAANPTQYAQSAFLPGGAAQNATWMFTVDFMTDSPAVEFRFNAPTSSVSLGLVFVNGKRVQERALRSLDRTAGAGYSWTLTFPAAATRRITIYGINNTVGRFGGAAVPTGYSVWKPVEAPKRHIAFIGDSYTGGAGSPPTGAARHETYMWKLGLLMGGDAFTNAGIGSTGFITTVGGDSDSVFEGRVDEVLAMNPDVIVIAGGRNDSGLGLGLQVAVEQLLQAVSSVPEVYVFSTASNTGQADTRSEIEAACFDQGVPYIDVDIDAIEKGADGIHPTWQGHQDLASAVYSGMV